MEDPVKNKVQQKYYNIGEAAKMFNVATSLVRYWESEFDILQPDKDEKGNRRYTEEDIEKLRLVYHLVKEKGFTLKGAKHVLDGDSDNVQKDMELLHSLKKVRSLLVELKEKI